ncbi:MAG: hypothetical protein Q4P28_03880 [Tissierellia bacterium]|nr:hypothetical protein [Tissierellia bacterium]
MEIDKGGRGIFGIVYIYKDFSLFLIPTLSPIKGKISIFGRETLETIEIVEFENDLEITAIYDHYLLSICEDRLQ